MNKQTDTKANEDAEEWLLDGDESPIEGHSSKVLLDNVTQRVKECLDKAYPDYVEYGNHKFTVEHGSTIVMVAIRSFTEDEACIECFAQVVTGCDINPSLMSYLLRKNAELHFGAFGMLFDHTVTFSHSITGSDMNEDEFLNSLKVVALISDYYDDRIVALAGGKRACDMSSDDLLENL
jgi:hypothetical protein